jgi:hypothetical protein
MLRNIKTALQFGAPIKIQIPNDREFFAMGGADSRDNKVFD